MEHTPIPWKTAGDGYTITTEDRGSLYVAQVHPFDLTGKPNAAYIVRACNAFPATEKVLEPSRLLLEQYRDYYFKTCQQAHLGLNSQIDELNELIYALAAGGE